MTNSVPQILPALALSIACAVSSAFAQDATSATPSQGGVPTAVSQASPSAKKKGRVRRTRVASKSQPIAQPSPATESPAPQASAATPASPGPTSPVAGAPASEVEPKVEPKVEPVTEEKPLPSNTDESPTAQERLRLQLKVVDQMVAAGNKQEAIAELHLLSKEDRFDPQGFYNIANAFARLDATDAAISTYQKAIDQRKGHYSRASNNLGVVLLRQGFWNQAYEAFLSALRAENFHYAEASYNLGRLYAVRGEQDLAMREWRRAVKVDPNHRAATRALAGVGNVSSPVVERRPAASRSVNRESSAITPARDSSPATATASRPLTVDPETYALLQRGREAHERGRYEEAVTSFYRVISRMGGYFSPANLELSYSLIELRRNNEAIAMLLLVAQKDGARLPISYYHLGRLYELRGDLKQSEDYYTRAVQSYQHENSQFLLNLSTVREKRGDFTGALSAMEGYVKRKEQQGQKPEWSDARLATLRQKVATPQNPPKQ